MHRTISNVPAKPIADITGLTPLVARNTNILINREEKHQLPGSYKLLQEQIQENQAKKQQEQQLQQLQQQQHQQNHLHLLFVVVAVQNIDEV